MSTPEYKIKIGGDVKGLEGATKKATGLLDGLSKKAASLQQIASQAMSGNGPGPLALLGGGGAVAGIAAASTALVANAARVAGLADEYGKLSQRTGVAVEDLSRLAYAVSLNDATLADLESGLRGLSKQMEASPEVFAKLGIAVRDSAGRMRPVKDVLFDVADAFRRLPDGAQKAAIASRLMEESGLRLIPTLNNGADGLRAMADEADRFGVTISGELAKKSAELNDSLVRMKAGAAGLANEVGAALVPALADFTVELLKSRAAGAGWGEAIWSGVFGPDDPAERLRDLTGELARLRSEREKMGAGEVPFNARIDDEIAQLEKRIGFYNRMIEEAAQAPAVAEQKTAAKRLQIENDLATARGRMFDLLAVKHGKASADILLDDDKRTAAQLKNAERLAKGYETAYEAAKKSAQEAAKAAADLLSEATGARLSGVDKAAARRMRDASPDELDANARRQASDLRDDARRSAVFAQNAALRGDMVAAERLAGEAAKAAERAEKYADQIEDNDDAANLLEELGRIQEDALKARAKVKEAEQADFESNAAQNLQALSEQRAEIERLQNIKIDADISEAISKLGELRSDLADIKDKVVTVTVKTVNDAALGQTLGINPEAHAAGGFIRGPGTGTSDSILARLSNGEYVIRAAAVQRYGVGFFEQLNRMTAAKFATGGLVRNIDPGRIHAPIASGSSGSGRTSKLELTLPGGDVVTAMVGDDFDARLAKAMRRAALARGSRR